MSQHNEPSSELHAGEADAASSVVSDVVFLVTDIEDSSSLWEADRIGMGANVAAHDQILTSRIAAGGGEVFKHTGDGMLSVFPSIDSAVTAAGEIQRDLTAHGWSSPGPVRVRMAIDIGPAQERSGDYFGPGMNRVMRLLDIGHGGQVILSDRVAGSTEARTTSLGRHDLKGVGRISVHQLGGGSFPPLRLGGGAASAPGFGLTITGYEVRERLGAGDFGVVYRARQISVGREVAIKVIRPDLSNQPDFVRRFEIEARFVAQLEHPHIVSLYDFWRDPSGAYLVMRWLRAGSVRSSLERGPFGLEAASRLISQVGSALAYAHRQGVIHRDLKPENVLLDDEGNAYLSDFGIATRLLDEGRNPTATSPEYVSPEERAGGKPSAASDVFSFGLLVYELLTARPPGGPRPSQIRPQLTPEVDELLAIATSADPTARQASVDEFVEAILSALGTETGGNARQVPVDTPLRNPYKGLHAYQETDAADFFGRDELVDDLEAMLQRVPLVAVVGPSGSGKSSVVRAGLLPRIRRSSNPRWLITDMFPGTYPFEELESALSRVASERVSTMTDDLTRDDLGLVRVTKRLVPDDTSLLLLIDQFEELFTEGISEETRERFMRALLAVAADSRSRVKVLLTLRADFFHRPLAYAEFGGLLRSGLVTVAMPGVTQLGDAIRKPAERVGLELEDGLVESIVEDVASEPGGLPLLQHALYELYERRDGRRLTIAAYRESGGVLGALTRRAEEVYLSFDDTARSVTRRVLLRLVKLDPDGTATRRRTRRSELEDMGLDGDGLKSVLEEFGRHRLLSFDRDPTTREPTVEPAHESLITQWARFAGWVDDRRDDLVTQQQLEAAAREWVDAGRSDGYLLKGGRLARFVDWLQGNDVTITATERELVEVSQAAERLAGEESAKRRRRVLVAVSTLAVVSTLAAVFGFLQQREAREQADFAAFQAELAAEQAELADAQRMLADQARTETERLAAATEAERLSLSAVGLVSSDPRLAVGMALAAADMAEEVGAPIPDAALQVFQSARAAHTPILSLRVPASNLSPLDDEGRFAVIVDRGRASEFEGGPLEDLSWGPGDLAVIDITGQQLATVDVEPTNDLVAVDGVVYVNQGNRFSGWDPTSGEGVGLVGIPSLYTADPNPVSPDLLAVDAFTKETAGDTTVLGFWRTVLLERNTLDVVDELPTEQMASFTADGSLAAYASADWESAVVTTFPDGDEVLRLDFAEPIHPASNQDVPLPVRISPDGRWLAVPKYADNRVEVYAVETGSFVSALETPLPSHIEWHPDSDRLLVAAPAGVVVFEARSGAVVDVLTGASSVLSIDVDPTGRYLASADLVSGAVIWDLAQDTTDFIDITTPFDLDLAKYNADGDLVISGMDGTVAVIRQGSSQPDLELTGFDPPGFRMVHSGDRTVIALTRGASAVLLDARTLEPVDSALTPGFIVFGMDGPGERLIVSGAVGVSGRAQVRDRQDRQVVLFEEGQAVVFDGGFFGEGQFIAVGDVGSGNGRFSIYDTSRQLVPVYVDDTIPASSTTLIEVSPDERYAIALGIDGVGRMYDLAAAVGGGEAIVGDINLRPGSPTGLRFVPGGDAFIIRDQLGTVTVYDVATLRPRYALTSLYANGSIDVSEDGTRMLVTNGRSIREFPIRPDDIVHLAEATFGRLSDEECRVLVSPDGCP